MKQRLAFKIVLALVGVVLVNVLVNQIDYQWDLTEDQRYTLSEEAKTAVANLESPITIDILLAGSLPAEFARLQQETVLLLEQFKVENKNIRYFLVNPQEGGNPAEIQNELQQIGLTPAAVTVEDEGKVSQELVYPWAMVNKGNKTVKVALLKNKLGATSEERINNSVQQLEYAFADAFSKLGLQSKKRIAVLKGNGELEDAYLADFITELKEYYNIGAFTLDSVATNPTKTLEALQAYDLALLAKPTIAFTDEEKYTLDQFMVNGGKSLWLLDQVAMNLDSLLNQKGENLATPINLNLNDILFRYGVRVNPVLVKDLYNTPIVLATGEANESSYNPLPWVYHPMVFSKNNHQINNNIEALRLQFSNTIDTLSNNYQKTILLESSPLSKPEGVPKKISLATIETKEQPQTYAGKGKLPLAVLVEGAFTSAYKNRIPPFKANSAKLEGKQNAMIVVADGDIIKNQLRNGKPLPLGYDKWTNNFYGNKEFLLNCVNYLLNDSGLINIRSKKVVIPLLDTKKIAEEKTKWQSIIIGIPLIIITLLGLGNVWYRKRKYLV